MLQETSGGPGAPVVALGVMAAAVGWAKSKAGAVAPSLIPN